MEKCIVYYTDSRLEGELAALVRKQIHKASGGMPIVSVSQKPLDFGNNICVGMKPPCYLSLYEQLLAGMEATPSGAVVYLCEHDVFYHPSHFKFIPMREDKIYYNLNRFYWNRHKDFFLRSIGKRALSQAVAYKDVLLAHAKEQVEARNLNIASPCRGPFLNFTSKFPNVDTRHGGNLSTFGKFEKSNKSPRVPSIPHWGTPRRLKDRVGMEEKNIKTNEILNAMFNYPRKENPVGVDIGRKDFPGMFNSLEFKKGAEIGVKRGDYSKVLCEGIPGLNLKCVDDYKPTPKYTWDEVESFFVMARRVLGDFDVQVIKKSSMQAADEDVPDESLDFVYIDADHSFNHVMRDVIVWSDKVRIGGVVSGHDYDDPDVRTAVDAYAKVHGIDLFETTAKKEKPSWFFAKE